MAQFFDRTFREVPCNGTTLRREIPVRLPEKRYDLSVTTPVIVSDTPLNPLPTLNKDPVTASAAREHVMKLPSFERYQPNWVNFDPRIQPDREILRIRISRAHEATLDFLVSIYDCCSEPLADAEKKVLLDGLRLLVEHHRALRAVERMEEHRG